MQQYVVPGLGKFVSLAILVLFLSSCASPPTLQNWPAYLPPQRDFVQVWGQDSLNQEHQSLDDYLLWVNRFYGGFNLVPGWVSMSEQVLGRVEPGRRDEVQARLAELGQLIGAEWAKVNDARTINTRAVAVWRDALLEALAQDDLDQYLSRLRSDVDALLQGEMMLDQIYFERYYEDEFDF